MSAGLAIAVIADDLTGAADTGVQFCPAVGAVYMAAGGQVALDTTDIRAAGLSVFTNSRHMTPPAAAEAVKRAAREISGLAPRLVYKKVDSCLRGNLGAEIDALLPTLGAAASFVAPAFPQQGRTTVNDRHLIKGVPVAETEIGRDPLCPVRESRLSALLAGQSRMTVGHVDLALLKKGPDALRDRVRTLLSGGCRHITFDAQTPSHLDAVAGLARRHFRDILLVGSAGLAGSLVRHLAGEAPSGRLPTRPLVKKWMFVCGSASRVLAEQAVELARHSGLAHVRLDPTLLADTRGAERRRALVGQLAAGGADRGLIIGIGPLSGEGPRPAPAKVVQGLAEVVAALLPAAAPEALFLSGGDTAEAVWRQIGATAILIQEEILPGLMRGELVGGRWTGLPVVTKAGAFGHPQTLLALFDALS